MSTVGRYLALRTVLAIPMVLILLSLIFVILRVIPGDPCLAMLGGLNVTPARLSDCRHTLGVDRPIGVQYLDYLLAPSCAGTSARRSAPASPSSRSSRSASLPRWN